MRPAILLRALLAAAAVLVTTAVQAQPAARVNDLTNHGGVVLPPGSSDVFIEGRPAVRLNDRITCPLFDGFVPHVGGPIVTASGNVFINGRPAARAGDTVSEEGTTSRIVGGAGTVFINTGQ
jgi:uncharacterized Zn-binding protein involved in type VI secretion